MAVSVAVIGAGAWGTKIMRACAALPELALRWVVSSNAHTAALTPPGCKVVKSLSDLPGTPELQGVIIATPPETHVPIATTFMDAGIACMIEKPLALNTCEADILLALAKQRRAFALVDHIYLYHSGYRALKATLPGPLSQTHIISRGGACGPLDRSTPVIWDWLPHDLSMILDLFRQDPIRVSCDRESSHSETAEGELYRLTLQFPDGNSAEILCGNGFAARRRTLTVETDGTRLHFSDEGVPALTRNGEQMPIAPTMPLDNILKRFAAGILAGEENHTDLELAARVVRAIERAVTCFEN